MPKKHKRCFVIMPFSQTSEKHTEEYWTKHFESFLKPLIEGIPELEAHRSEPLRGDVLKQIITNLVVSPIVVADITDMNPNVFWELGVRQSFKHCTVTIAEEGTKIPFDISVKGTLFYFPKDHIKNAEFIKKFKRAINDCMAHPDRPDSHVLETVLGRGTLFQITRRDEAIRRMEALFSEQKWNSDLMGDIYQRLKKEKPPIPPGRFRFQSIGLLVTQRYLDEEPSFYESAEDYLVTLQAANEVLGYWPLPGGRPTTEKWLSRTKEILYEYSKTYQDKLKKAREKLLASR